MPRRKNKRRVQRSKRARDTLKQARFAGVSRRTGHPCHFTGRGHWWRWGWVRNEAEARKWRGMCDE